MKINKGIIFGGLFFLLTFGSCMLGMQPQIGYFPESSFTLSPDSRFPRWFNIPSGYDRKDLTVEIIYYVPWFGKTNLTTILIGPPPNNQKLDKKYGNVEWHPISKKNLESGTNHYPSFHIASVDGVIELIEHKKMEPIFYISDDPKLMKR
jgi:hypothetical protein